MALKKKSPAPERRNPFIVDDPAVAAALSSADETHEGAKSTNFHKRESESVYERTARLRSLTPAQRRKLERDAARTKLTVDLPSDTIERLNAIANAPDDNFPISQLVTLLLKRGLAAIEAGEIDLEQYKIHSRVPRFRWFLVEDETAP